MRTGKTRAVASRDRITATAKSPNCDQAAGDSSQPMAISPACPIQPVTLAANSSVPFIMKFLAQRGAPILCHRVGPMASAATGYGCFSGRARPLCQPPPIKAPAAKTSAPPKTTCKAALRNGVSMNLFWIQAMAHNSTKTTIMAMMVAVQNSGIR